MNLWTSGVTMLMTPRPSTGDELRNENAAHKRKSGRNIIAIRSRETAKNNAAQVFKQFTKHGLELHAAGIAAKTGISNETVRQALKRLEFLSMIEKCRVEGRRVYFRKTKCTP